MSIELRVVLIVVSIITLLFILRRVRSSKVRIEDAVFWVCLAVFILLMGVFTDVFVWVSRLIGIDAPVHFVFLFFIFVLLVMCFHLNMRISRADTRIKELAQQLAVEKHERYRNDREGRGQQGR